MSDATPPVPAGWYPNPDAPGLKYWDGTQWTEHTAPEQSLGSSPGGPPPPAVVPGAPSYPPYGGGAPAWGAPDSYPSGYASAPAKNDANTLSIIGMVCGGISLLFCPILFGPVGIVLGVVAVAKGERLGWAAVGVAAAGMIFGFVLGLLIFTSMTGV